MRWLRTLVTTAAALVLISGCEDDSNLRTMRDYDLSESYAKCLDRKPTAPGQVQACENIRLECERRRRELGTFVCRTQ